MTRTTKQPAPAPKLKSPGKLNLKKGRRVAEQVVRENLEWLKEMAKK